MRILAIETTDQSGSVAALVGDRVIDQRNLDPAQRSAQSLAPAIESLLTAIGWQPREVQLVAAANGPGSFTGLRVGVTTAKMFAYAIGASTVGVNTLEAIAWQVAGESRGASQLWTVLDAQREQVFAARFLPGPAQVWQWDTRTLLLDNAAWLEQLSPGQAVSGPRLTTLIDVLPVGVIVADRSQWSPKAATIGRLAWRYYQAGCREDVVNLVPQYYRPSAAEEHRGIRA